MWVVLIVAVIIVIWILQYLRDREKSHLLKDAVYRRSEVSKIIEEEYQSYWGGTQIRLDKEYKDLQRAKDEKDTAKIKETKALIRRDESFLEGIKEVKKDFDNPKSSIWNNESLDPYDLQELNEAREEISTEFSSVASGALYTIASKRKLKRERKN